MRFWDLSSSEVGAADAEPWDGPLMGVMRAVPMRVIVQQWVISTVLAAHAGGVALVIALADPGLAHPTALLVLGLLVISVGVLFVVGISVPSASAVRRYSPPCAVVAVLSMGVLCSAAAWAVGPKFGIVTIFYVEALPFAFYLFTLRWALLTALNAVSGCAVVMFWQDGWAAPACSGSPSRRQSSRSRGSSASSPSVPTGWPTPSTRRG